MIKEFHESQNISPISDFTNTTTDTRTTLSVIIRLYNGSTSLGETVWNVTTTGIQTMYSVVVSSTPITRIYIKHNGSRLDIPILDINVDFPNGQFWFTANYISINPTVAGGIQLSNMMLNRGSSALPYEPYGDTWNAKSYAKSITGAQTYTKFPIVLRTTEQSIPTWSVKGNIQQTGTPTPTSPITPSECGMRTENLANENNLDLQKWISSSGNISDNHQGTIFKGKIAITTTNYTVKATANQSDVSGIGAVIYNSNDEFIRREYTTNNTLTFATTTGDNYFKIIVATAKISTESLIKSLSVMANEGSTALPYEPYGYKIPVISGNTTTNIYLSEPLRKINTYYDQLTHTGLLLRGIKKLVLTGQEEWQNNFGISLFGTRLSNAAITRITALSSHYTYNPIQSGLNNGLPNGEFALQTSSPPTALYIKDESYTTVETWKTYLAAQYSAGTPVTVWYVLTTPAIETATTSTIPTTSGLNTIDVATTLKPSEMSLTFDGYKPCKRQRYSRTENLFDYDSSEIGAIDITTGQDVEYDNARRSDYISVEANDTITISGQNGSLRIFEYDTNKTYLDVNFVYNNSFSIANSGYIRFVGGLGGITETIMLNTGSTAKPYQPYLVWK